jgi:hypothetical protein
LKVTPQKFHKSIFIFFLIHGFCSYSQRKIQYQTELSSFVSSETKLPFWMDANTQGLVRNQDNAGLILGFNSDFSKNNPNRVDFAFGSTFYGFSSSEKTKLEINELFASAQYKKIRLTAGSKHETIRYNGLSSTNGNIIYSGNARPLPGISLKTSEFIPILFDGKLSFHAEFGEYFLNDDRFVDDAQMHHKSLSFKIITSDKSNLTVGVEDYAIWAGTSPELGKLPSGLDNFLRVVGGFSGSGDAPDGDLINALGNHIGAYRVAYQKNGEKTAWEIYWSHPFEDTSGRELNNIEDGLYGLFLDFKKPESILSHLLFEFTYTKNQSGKGQIHGFDDFFNNTIYRSGYTFFGRSIGSPFFTPAEEDGNGITKGVSNNSFIAYHTGFGGKLANNLRYKTLLSYSINEGTKATPFSNSRNQFSGLLDLNYETSKLPFSISLGLGVDGGSLLDDSFGVYIKLFKMGIF